MKHIKDIASGGFGTVAEDRAAGAPTLSPLLDTGGEFARGSILRQLGT